jgi:Bacterial membrane protein YfhO
MAKSQQTRTPQPQSAKNKASSAPTKPSALSPYIPHLVAALVFLVVTFIFFSPVITGDKVLPQGDISQYNGASKEIVDYYAKTQDQTLWTNAMFGGMPAFQISTLYKGNLVHYLNNFMTLFLPQYTGYLFLASMGFYILLLMLGVSPWLAIGGGLAYCLSSYNIVIIEAGHNTKMHSIALLPYVVTGFVLLWHRRYLLGAAVSAAAFALMVYANHIQIAYYLFLTILIAAVVFLVFSTKDFKRYILAFGIFAICAGAGVLSNLSLLWSTYEYGNSTIRGKSELTSNTQSKGGLDRDYAFQWSYGKAEILTTLIPNLYGGSSHETLDEGSATVRELQAKGVPAQAMPTYWGPLPFTSGPAYLGALVLFLFVLGLFVVDGPFKWWLGIATLFSFMLSMGHNLSVFNNPFFDYFPGYNKFRTVTMALVISQFTVPLLAILAAARVLSGEIDKQRLLRGLYMATAATAGVTLLIAIMGGSFFHFAGDSDKQLPEWLISPLRADRGSMMRSDAWRSFIFIVLGAGTIWAYLTDKLSRGIVMGALSLLILIDMAGVGKRYINENSFTEEKGKQSFNPSPADESILRDPALDYRVFNTTVNSFNDASTSYFHKSVGGYHAAKLRRYQELIERQISKGNMSVLNMLNARYIIQKGANGEPQAAQNPAACGNAWFVNEVKSVNNADEEMASLDKFDPLQTAVVDKRFAADIKGFTGGKDSASSIRMTSYEPNHLVYNYTASHNQLAVFSEIYYQPGWSATVDGKDMPVVRANYVLRAMELPAGTHKVEMRFHPDSFYTGEKVAAVVSALILLLLVFAIYQTWRNKEIKVADATLAV